MKVIHLFFIRRTLLSLLFLLTLSLNSHAKVMHFNLNNVITRTSEVMTGSFDWQYTEGDFENGSGLFTELYIPRYGTDISALDITVDLSSIEFTLAGNFHSQEVDINLRLLTPLSTTQPSNIDISFDGTNYASKFSVFGFGTLPYQGGFLSGTIAAASAVPNPGTHLLLSVGLLFIGISARRNTRT